MSLPPQKIETIPAETVRVAKAAFPKGNFCLKLRDELGTLYQDEQFVKLFSSEGLWWVTMSRQSVKIV